MPELAHGFIFDTNFGAGNESVFTLIDNNQTPPTPPIVGYFLYLNNTPFGLLNGGNLDLL